MGSEIDLSEYVWALWRRRLLIASVTLLGAVAALGFDVWRQRPVYQATALLMVSDPQVYLASPWLGGVSIGSGRFLSPEVLITLVRNGAVAAEAARRVPGGAAPSSDRVAVAVVRGTNLVSVSAHAATADDAFVLATAWTEAVVASAEQLAAREMRRATGALDSDVAAARRQVAAAEAALREFHRTSSLVEVEGRMQEAIRRIALLETRAVERRSETATGRSDKTRGAIQALRAEVRALQARVAEEHQRDAQVTAAAEEARADLRWLLDQQRALRIRQRASAGEVGVVAPASRPSGPVPTRRLSGPFFGAVLGCLAGITLALSLESLRPRASVAP